MVCALPQVSSVSRRPDHLIWKIWSEPQWPHFRDARQIGIMDRMGKAGRFLAKPRQRSLAARSGSRHKDDPGAHLRELFGSDPPAAAD